MKNKKKFNIGDKVVFKRLFKDCHEAWMMTEEQFCELKTFLDKVGTVEYINKHYNEDESVSYFIDVLYDSYRLRRINQRCFDSIESDFDFL